MGDLRAGRTCIHCGNQLIQPEAGLWRKGVCPASFGSESSSVIVCSVATYLDPHGVPKGWPNYLTPDHRGRRVLRVARISVTLLLPSAKSPVNLRLNPPFLLIRRTKSGFYAEFGPPDMQESCFWRNVSVFLGPRNLGLEFGAVPMAV